MTRFLNKKHTIHRTVSALAGVLLALAFVAGCSPGPTTGACQASALKVGLITDVTGIDGTVNRQLWSGLERAGQELGVCTEFLESRSDQDYARNITELGEQHFDLIVASSAQLLGAVQQMAGDYPSTQFVIADAPGVSPLPNVSTITFRVDQAAFLAGYLAAAWATTKDPGGPRVAYVASRENPAAEQYVKGFQAGVSYFDSHKGGLVQLDGVYVGDSEVAVDAQAAATSFFDWGADVLFEVDGAVPLGGLAIAEERGKWGIGADLDLYLAQPNVREILLTSAVKLPENAIGSFVKLMDLGGVRTGMTMAGTLENAGVGLAPFHDMERSIPDSVKQDLAEVEQDLLAGAVSTAWAP